MHGMQRAQWKVKTGESWERGYHIYVHNYLPDDGANFLPVCFLLGELEGQRLKKSLRLQIKTSIHQMSLPGGGAWSGLTRF